MCFSPKLPKSSDQKNPIYRKVVMAHLQLDIFSKARSAAADMEALNT